MDHAVNPVTGLKASLARMLSGGVLGLIFGLLFRRRILAALAKLEQIFAQWQAGTLIALPALPALPAPSALPVRTAPTQVPPARTEAPHGRTPSACRPSSRCAPRRAEALRPGVQPAVRSTVIPIGSEPKLPAASRRRSPIPHRARCTNSR